MNNKSELMRDIKNRFDMYLESVKNGYLLYIDMDNLKYINDNYGHEYGDRCIRYTEKLLEEARNKYGISEFRVGGDEFIVFCEKNVYSDVISILSNKEIEDDVIRRIGIEYRLSIGGCEFPKYSSSFDTLSKYADLTMYVSKHSKNIELFDDSSLNIFKKVDKVSTDIYNGNIDSIVSLVFVPRIKFSNYGYSLDSIEVKYNVNLEYNDIRYKLLMFKVLEDNDVKKAIKEYYLNGFKRVMKYLSGINVSYNSIVLHAMLKNYNDLNYVSILEDVKNYYIYDDVEVRYAVNSKLIKDISKNDSKLYDYIKDNKVNLEILDIENLELSYLINKDLNIKSGQVDVMSTDLDVSRYCTVMNTLGIEIIENKKTLKYKDLIVHSAFNIEIDDYFEVNASKYFESIRIQHLPDIDRLAQ